MCLSDTYYYHHLCITDAPGAMEMSWLQVKPEELMEPTVTVVTRQFLLMTSVAYNFILD